MMADKRNILGNLMLNRQQPDRAQSAKPEDSRQHQSNQKQLQPQQRASSTAGGRQSGASSASGRQHKLKQRFSVIKKLGKGTYGKVQLAINKETGQEVAIKTIKKSKIENEQDLERVRREIQIMSSIEHPHIIHIYEVFENRDKIVLVMQYAPGGELYEYVSQAKLLDDQEARRIFRQIATAIYYCHQNKICHRDLKLENILLDEKNNAKLADFGLSNVFDKSYQLRTFCGSPLYASPEIVQGSPYEGPEVDCWSLGVLLYTLVYGSMPFDGTNFKRLVKQISEASYFEPKTRSQASPLIRRLLCADPVQRANIVDICQDPWVNRVNISPSLTSPASPRSSPTPPQPSLLKVAQDMASLTPVRLDILTAIAPPTPLPPSSKRSLSTEDAPMEASDATVDKNIPEVELQAEVQPALIEVEMKTTSEAQAMEQQSLPLDRISPAVLEIGLEQEPVSMQQVQDAEQPHEEVMQVEQTETLKEPQVIENIIEEPTVLSGSSQNPIVQTQSQQAIKNISETLRQDLASETILMPPEAEQAEKLIEVKPEETIEEQTDRTEAQDEDKESAPEITEESRDEPPKQECEKPKKVKKKIVIVKKKRKVAAKKDITAPVGDNPADAPVILNDDKLEQEDKKAEDSVVELASKATELETETEEVGPKKKVKTTKPKPRKSVGKVQIPETFSGGGAESSGNQTPILMKVEGRRQSSMIADVSQRLLQQLQADANVQPTGSAAVAADQAQLMGVVADKKDEFERRASLAAQLLEQPPIKAKIWRDSADGSNKTESISQLDPVSVELVEGFQPPVEAEERTLTQSVPGNLGEPATQTSVQAELAAPREDRSDSVETIKQNDKVPTTSNTSETSEPPTPKVRSNLEIQLAEAVSGEKQNLEDDSPAASVSAITLGPVPITRSYKKVTFTKDGACITEMGKIYSKKAADGTVKHVERKTKITHYPALKTGEESATAESHVEVKSFSKSQFHNGSSSSWESRQHNEQSKSSSGQFQQSVASSSSRAFERLILPSDDLADDLMQAATLNHSDEEDGYDDDDDQDDFFFHKSPFLSRKTLSMGRQQETGAGDAASSCSSESTDIFEDIFDTWTGSISMFNQRRPSIGSQSSKRDLQQRLREQWQPFPRPHHHHYHRHHQHHRKSGRPASSMATPSTAQARPMFEVEQSLGGQRGDQSAFERPNSAFGASDDRFGNMFASNSNLFFSRARNESPFPERQLNLLDDFGIQEEIDRKHAKLKQSIAKQHKQLWKGSTPSLFSGGGSGSLVDQSNADSLAQDNVKGQPEQMTSSVLQKSTSVSRSINRQQEQVTATECGLIRRNTSELPPKSQTQSNPIYRTVSKTSLITSQFSSLQLGGQQQQANGSDSSIETPKQVTSFIELRRTLSNTSIQKEGTDKPLAEQRQVHSVQTKTVTTITTTRTSGAAGTGCTISSSGSNSAVWDGSSDKNRLNARSPLPPRGSPKFEHPSEKSEREEVDSRIQSWLQDSASNLSSSSGSKSSASCSTSHYDPFNSLYGSSNLRSQGPSRLSGTSSGQLPPRVPSPREQVSEQQLLTTSSLSGTDGSQKTAGTKITSMTIQLRGSDSASGLQLQQQSQGLHEDLDWIRTSHHTIEASDSTRDDLSSSFGPTDFVSQSHSNSSSYLLDQLKSLGYRSMINQRMDNTGKLAPESASQSTTRAGSHSGSPEMASRSVSSRQTVLTSIDQIIADEDSGISLNQQNSPQSQPNGTNSTGSPQTAEVSCSQVESSAPNLAASDSRPKLVEVSEQLHQVEPELGQATSNEKPEQEPEEDEDIKEAKASVRAYLERIKETEQFLKSCREEEANSARQRQELFLFNNLMFASKLSSCGVSSGSGNFAAVSSTRNYSPLDQEQLGCRLRQTQLDSSQANGLSPLSSSTGLDLALGLSSNAAAAGGEWGRARASSAAGGFGSAPIRSSYQRAGLSSTQANNSASSAHMPVGCEPSEQVNEFFSGFYPVANCSPLGSYSAGVRPTSSCVDGGNSSFRYSTIKRNFPSFNRSVRASGTSEQGSTDLNDLYTPATSRQQQATRRPRPLSASIENYDSSSLFGGSNLQTTGYNNSNQRPTRRSCSQIRAPSRISSSSNSNNTAYMSEYQRAYCATSGSVSVEAAASDNFEPIADFLMANSNNCSQKNNDDDDVDSSMEAYRASAYVPKVVPIGELTSSSRMSRRSYQTSRRSEPLSAVSSRTNSSFETTDSSSAEMPRRRFSERRSSLQPRSADQVGGGAGGEMNLSSCRLESQIFASSSGATADDSSNLEPANEDRQTINAMGQQAQLGDQSKGPSSRLSELEQRIQANKRRREQLLANGGASLTCSEAGNEHSPTPEAGEHNCGAQANGASRQFSQSSSLAAKPYKPLVGRPSRLESMEARIKRKSYYVRVTASSPTERHL